MNILNKMTYIDPVSIDMKLGKKTGNESKRQRPDQRAEKKPKATNKSSTLRKIPRTEASLIKNVY